MILRSCGYETLIVIVVEVRSRDFNTDGDHGKDGALHFEASEYGCRKTVFGFLRGKLQDSLKSNEISGIYLQQFNL